MKTYKDRQRFLSNESKIQSTLKRNRNLKNPYHHEVTETLNKTIQKSKRQLDKTIKPIYPKKKTIKLSSSQIRNIALQQKQKQLQDIYSISPLKQYYKAFVFTSVMSYQTAISIISGRYEKGEIGLLVRAVSLIPIYGQIVSAGSSFLSFFYQKSNHKKLLQLSKNILSLSSSLSLFQKKIEFIARKLCTHNMKRKQIINCVSSEKSQNFWDSLFKLYQSRGLTMEYQLMEGMFERGGKCGYRDAVYMIKKCFLNGNRQEDMVGGIHPQIGEALSFQYGCLDELFSQQQVYSIEQKQYRERCNLL